MTIPNLIEWNRQALALNQALLGAISPNFRLVYLDYIDEIWEINFILETENPEDREEIEDIITQFEALQETSTKFIARTHVCMNDLNWPKIPARVIFKRREN